MTDTNDRNDLEREQEARSRIIDLLFERKHDEKRGLKKSEFSYTLIELNIRLSQYVQQFKSFSLEFLIVQTLQDFKKNITVMQTLPKTLDYKRPVAEMKDKLIYIDPNIQKSDYVNSSNVELFTHKEPLK